MERIYLRHRYVAGLISTGPGTGALLSLQSTHWHAYTVRYCRRINGKNLTNVSNVFDRSAVVTAVYRKALRMTSAATHASTIGAVVNLMSVDSQRFMDFMNQVQLLWWS